MTLYRCAIAPVDQSSTNLGWGPGSFRRTVPTASGDWGWTQEGLQFLADPGTPVVAPFPVQVVSTSPFVVHPTVDVGLVRPYNVRIDGTQPAAPAGASLDKGALLGRIVPNRAGGTRWTLWGPDPVFGTVGAQSGITAMFGALGLEVVGSGDPSPYPSGFAQVPGFGGKLLARSAGPAGAGCAPAGAIHGLGAYGLGSAAPAGYVDPQASVYSRYGTSSQSSSVPPAPVHENVSPARAAVGAGAGIVAIAAVAGLAWLWSKG